MLSSGVARGFAVPSPRTLTELDTQADLVFKGIAVSNKLTGPAPETDGSGMSVMHMPGMGVAVKGVTQFKIVSLIKGDLAGATLTFLHNEILGPENKRPGWTFQAGYHFEPGRAYLVFAKKANTAGLYEQLIDGASEKTDEGAFRCFDPKPVKANTIQEIVWNELVALLHSGTMGEVEYAMFELDEMSGGDRLFSHGDAGLDFQRQDVTELIHGLVFDPHPQIAQTAIAAIGSHNPYMDEQRAVNWLATVGAVPPSGVTGYRNTENIGGTEYWKDLAAAADGKADGETRAMAISALGLVRQPELEKHLDHWLADPDAAVRSSAVVLLADYPDMATRERISKLAADSDPGVDRAAARTIGFGQQAEFADILATLLKHPDLKARKYAAMSLLSFSPKTPAVAAVLEANVDNPEIGYLVVNALATEHPEKYLDRLAETAREGFPVAAAPPRIWWGGRDPAWVAWQTLLKYIEAQDTESLRAGKFDKLLDALEQAPKPSASRKDLAAFYQKEGMTARARNLNAKEDK